MKSKDTISSFKNKAEIESRLKSTDNLENLLTALKEKIKASSCSTENSTENLILGGKLWLEQMKIFNMIDILYNNLTHTITCVDLRQHYMLNYSSTHNHNRV